MKKFEKPELIIYYFEEIDTIGESGEEWGGDIGGGTDSQAP